MNRELIYSIGQELKEKLIGIDKLHKVYDVLRLVSSDFTQLTITVKIKPKAGQEIVVPDMIIITNDGDPKTQKLIPSKLIGSEAILLGLKKRIDRAIDLREAEAESLRQKMQEVWK